MYVRHFLQKHKEAPPGFEGSPLYKCGHEPCEELFLTEINLQKHIKNIHEEHFKTKVGDFEFCILKGGPSNLSEIVQTCLNLSETVKCYNLSQIVEIDAN